MVEHSIEKGYQGLRVNKVYDLVIAGSDAPAAIQDYADYLCDGSDDERVINTALASLPSSGGRILMVGTFTLGAPISETRAIDLVVEGFNRNTKFTSAAAVDLWVFTGAVNVTFKDVEMDGDSTATKGIETAAAESITCLGCYIHDFATADVDYNGTFYSDVFDLITRTLQGAFKMSGRILGQVHRDVFFKVQAEAQQAIVADEDLTAETPIECSLAGQPEVPRTLKFVITDGDTGITAYQITIVGVGARGQAITETFDFDTDGLTFETENAFATVTSVTVDSITGDGAGDVLDVGTGSKLGLSRQIGAIADVFKVQENGGHKSTDDWTAEADFHTVDVSDTDAIVNDDTFIVHYKVSA